MRFINELHEGDRLNGIYLCKQKQSAMTKNGKPYENLILQDKTGVLDGKIWDPNSLGIDDFDALDYIDVVGDVTTFAGAMQLNIKRVRKAQEGEYDPADYLPVSENSTDDMYGQLLAMIKSVNGKARTEAQVAAFNKAIYRGLCSGRKRSFTYINTCTNLQMKGWISKKSGTDIYDGLHYSNPTYLRIFDYCMRYLNR